MSWKIKESLQMYKKEEDGDSVKECRPRCKTSPWYKREKSTLQNDECRKICF